MSASRVVVYSAALKRYCAPLLAGYAARYPQDEIDFHDDISVALDRRYRDEIAAGTPSADVVWSSAMDMQATLVREGHALPFTPKVDSALPEGSVYRDSAFATTVEPLVTLVHADVIGSEPAGALVEIADLIEREPARLRGRVISYDLARNGLGFLAMLHERRLRPGFERYLRGLRTMAPRIHAWNPSMIEELADARAVVSPHMLGSFVERALAAHPTLAVAASAFPAIAVSRVAFVSRHARNPEGGQRFIEYLLSDEGQSYLDASGLFPMRRPQGERARGVAALPHAPIRLDETFDALLDPAMRQDLMASWADAAGVPLPVQSFNPGEA